MITLKRGTMIDGEFVEGVKWDGRFVATKYRRGAKGLLVMLPGPARKRRRVSRVKRHNILKFAPRLKHQPGTGGEGCRPKFLLT